jgi:hypothetical protein
LTFAQPALMETHGQADPGCCFAHQTGQLLQVNTVQDSLHPILNNLEHVKGGFSIFRRFRITELKKSDCPISFSKRRLSLLESGGRDRDRTGDLLVANEALSQLSYSPTSS